MKLQIHTYVEDYISCLNAWTYCAEWFRSS